jgi:sec-independent protein translocase protein TatC
MMTKRRKQQKNRQLQLADPVNVRFIEHLYELRKRLFYVACSVIVWGSVAYFIQQKLVNALLKPSHGQQFIYTSPIGGISFLFNVCIYFGIALSIPVIVYQILRFIQPVINESSKKFITKFSIIAGLLAISGIAFGYFMGLPLALGFLSHQFTNKQIKALFSIQEYMSFVSLYIVGSALLFQIPLILWFVNRIKPMKPKKLIHYERWVVAGAFLISALMAPTINVFSQLIIAGPIIISYQVAIVLIWLKNRSLHRRYKRSVRKLMEQDQRKRAERQGAFQRPLKFPEPAAVVTEPPKQTLPPHLPVRRPRPVVASTSIQRATTNYARLINDVRPTRPLIQL